MNPTDLGGKSFWRWLFRMHQHEWLIRFRGRYTTGVECQICQKAELLQVKNDGTGWVDEYRPTENSNADDPYELLERRAAVAAKSLLDGIIDPESRMRLLNLEGDEAERAWDRLFYGPSRPTETGENDE